MFPELKSIITYWICSANLEKLIIASTLQQVQYSFTTKIHYQIIQVNVGMVSVIQNSCHNSSHPM